MRRYAVIVLALIIGRDLARRRRRGAELVDVAAGEVNPRRGVRAR